MPRWPKSTITSILPAWTRWCADGGHARLCYSTPDPEADAAWERVKAGDTSDLVEQWRPQPDGVQHVYRKDLRGQWVFVHTQPTVEV